MAKLNITWIGQKKDINTKFGIKQKQSIKATQHGDNYLEFWCSPMTNDWAVGKEIEVLEVKSREYNGKTYYDIVLPKANMGGSAEVMKALEEIRNTGLTRHMLVMKGLGEIFEAVTGGKKMLDTTPNGTHYPTPEEEGITLEEDVNF